MMRTLIKLFSEMIYNDLSSRAIYITISSSGDVNHRDRMYHKLLEFCSEHYQTPSTGAYTRRASEPPH